MKKTCIILALLIAMIFSVVACSKKDKQAILTAHFIGGSPADLQLVEDKVNEYISEKYDIKIKMIYTDFGDFDGKANLMVTSGEDYDIIFSSSWANNYLERARKGAFLDITDYLETDEFSDLYNTIDESFWNGARIDGRIYAVPTQKEIALMQMYMYNKKIIEDTGFDYKSVKSIRDVEPYLRYVKEYHPDIIPFYLSNDRQYRGSYDYVLGFDLPILVDENNKVRFSFEMPDIIDNFRAIRKYFQLGYINQDAPTTSGTMGKGFIFGMSQAEGQPYAEIIWSNDSGFDLVAYDAYTPVATTQSTRGSMLAINSNSKYQKEALIFLQALNTDSILHNMINYGVEGVHYEMVNDSQINRTPKGENYIVPTFALGNLFNTHTLSNSPKDKWKVFQKVNADTVKSRLLGFNAEIDTIKNEIAAMNNVSDQYESLIITGVVDTDSGVTKYRKKMLEVGMQKVIDEVQKQVDGFIRKNN